MDRWIGPRTKEFVSLTQSFTHSVTHSVEDRRGDTVVFVVGVVTVLVVLFGIGCIVGIGCIGRYGWY